MAGIYGALVKKFPIVKRNLRQCHSKDTPELFMKKVVNMTVIISITLTILSFFVLSMMQKPLVLVVLVFIVSLAGSFQLMLHSLDAQIRKRDKEIQKEILFAGRFILVKIESGQPFYNALIDASKGSDVAAKYFKEIVDAVETGTPIEKALEDAVEYAPNENFRRILWQINNALRTGIDVGTTLRSILKQITEEQVIEIKTYGKKLNSIAMFYMLIGIVVPALGMTMFIIISSFLSIKVGAGAMIAVLAGLSLLQSVFIIMFRSIRPAVNL